MQIYRRHDIMDLLKIKRSALDELRRSDPSFPRPAYVNRTPLWLKAEVEDWVAARFAARSSSQIFGEEA